MRSRWLVGGSVVIVMSLALCLGALVQTAAAQSECKLTIEPETAKAGTVFQLGGSGFTPTQLILQKDGNEAVTTDLDLGSQDPFEIPIGSHIGDEGRWSATASLPDTCSPKVTFTVTLENTDAPYDMLAGRETTGHFPLMLVALIVVVGFGGGAAVAWRLNRT